MATGSNDAAWMGHVEGWNFGKMAGGPKQPEKGLEIKEKFRV